MGAAHLGAGVVDELGQTLAEAVAGKEKAGLAVRR